MRISISKTRTILQIIGEEDSIGLDNDQKVQDALLLIDEAIQAKIDSGELSESDILVSFR